MSALFVYQGLNRKAVGFAAAGEIIAVAGMAGIGLGESIADADDPRPLPSLSIDEPTLSMEFAVNDSPFSGRDGRFMTSRHLRETARAGSRAQPRGSP